MKGRRIKIPLLAGHHRPASETPLKWRADDGPTLNAGLVALWFLRGSVPVLLRNPIFLWFSGGGGGPDPLSPPGSAHDFGCSCSTPAFRPSLCYLLLYMFAITIYHKVNHCHYDLCLSCDLTNTNIWNFTVHRNWIFYFYFTCILKFHRCWTPSQSLKHTRLWARVVKFRLHFLPVWCLYTLPCPVRSTFTFLSVCLSVTNLRPHVLTEK